jgi:hypothetical protein
MSKMILAIGGPNNFEWVHDYGSHMRVLDSDSLPTINFTDSIPLAESVYDPPIVEYRQEKLGDTKTGAIKRVYVSTDLTFEQAFRKLQEWLMTQFINMESPDDSDW